MAGKIHIVAVRIVDNHAEYAIEREGNPSHRVWRRYRDFENLRKSLLLDRTVKHLVPELPPKQSWWASRSTSVTNQRKVALEAFLRKIEDDQLVASEDKRIAWEAFFEDSHPNGTTEASTYLDSSHLPVSPRGSMILNASSTSNPFEEGPTAQLEHNKLEREIESIKSATSDDISRFLKALEEEREESRILRERVQHLESELVRLQNQSNLEKQDGDDEVSLPSLESDGEGDNPKSDHSQRAFSKPSVVERLMKNAHAVNETTILNGSDISGISSVQTDGNDNELDTTRASTGDNLIEQKSSSPFTPFKTNEEPSDIDDQPTPSVLIDDVDGEEEDALSDVSAIPHVPEESAFEPPSPIPNESSSTLPDIKYARRQSAYNKPPLHPGRRSDVDETAERHPMLMHTRTPLHQTEQARPARKPESVQQMSALSSVASISGIPSVVEATNDNDDQVGRRSLQNAKRRTSLGASRGDRSSLVRDVSSVNASIFSDAPDRPAPGRRRSSWQFKAADSRIESTIGGVDSTEDATRNGTQDFGAATVITSSAMVDEADTPSFASELPSILNRSQLSDNDSTLEALIRAMFAKASTSETVARFGSRSILDLCCESPHALEALGRLGACEAVLIALKSFPHSEAVVVEACGAVFNLSFDDENAKELKRLGAFSLLLNALSTLGASNAGVAFASLSALLNLSSKDAADKRKIFRLGGVRVIIETLNEWGTVNLQVATEACALLRNLAEEATMARDLGNCRANDAVLLVLHSSLPLQDKDLALECVLCVRNLSVDEINRSALCGTKSNVRMLLKAIEKHASDPTMALQAAFAVRNLASKNEINAQLLGECGACELLLLIAQHHPQHPDDEELAYALAAAIWNLCFCPSATARLLRHGLPRYLVHAARQQGSRSSKVAAVQCGAVFRAVSSGGVAARRELNRAGIQGALKRISPNPNLAAALEMVTTSWS